MRQTHLAEQFILSMALVKTYPALLISLGLVYVLGAFLPLMQNDSAQHAVMAMQLYQKGDFLHLFRGSSPYLDKPHMHFWLAALSYYVFGLHEWAYRLPSLIFTLIAAYSIYRIGRTLKNQSTGETAAIIFLSFQTILLANHDVRTDAILTGATTLGLWQLIEYCRRPHLVPMLVGALALGIAFSTKGHIALLVAGGGILAYTLKENNWSVWLNWKTMAGLLMFALAISPMLCAYYVQFGREGIEFILYNQYIERFQSKGFEVSNPDYFFFAHTLLWAALPWSVILYLALFKMAKNTFGNHRVEVDPIHYLVLGGAIAPLVVLSLSSYKLPHYLNIFMPLFALVTANYIMEINFNKPTLVKRLRIAQSIVLSIGFILVITIASIVFPLTKYRHYVILALLFCIPLYYLWTPFENMTRTRFVKGSVWVIIAVNLFLNGHFYPNLLNYQGSRSLAQIVNKEGIPKENIFSLDDDAAWTMNFETQKFFPVLTTEMIRQKPKPFYLVLSKSDVESVQMVDDNWTYVAQAPNYAVSCLDGKFLNKRTRLKELDEISIIKFTEEDAAHLSHCLFYDIQQ